MSTPQDSRARRRLKKKRTLKNAAWHATRAQENAEADKPKTAAKTAT